MRCIYINKSVHICVSLDHETRKGIPREGGNLKGEKREGNEIYMTLKQRGQLSEEGKGK